MQRNGNDYMFKKLRDKYLNFYCLVASLYALSLIVFLSFVNIANAHNSSETKTPKKTIDISQIEVPFKNITGLGTDVAKSSAAAQSKDGQVVIFFGVTEEAGKAAYKALQEMMAEGSIELNGMYIADALELKVVNGYLIQSEQAIMTYAGAQRTSTIQNPSVNVGEILKEQLRKDYQEIIFPRRKQNK